MFHFNSNVLKGLLLLLLFLIFKALPNFSRSSLPNPWILKVFSFEAFIYSSLFGLLTSLTPSDPHFSMALPVMDTV